MKVPKVLIEMASKPAGKPTQLRSRSRNPDVSISLEWFVGFDDPNADRISPPAFLEKIICDSAPLTTALIRKIWGMLQDKGWVAADRKRPIGESEIRAFVFEMMSRPGAGRTLESSARKFDSTKVFRVPGISFHFDKNITNLSINWEPGCAAPTQRAQTLANLIFQCVWVLGVLPKKTDYEHLIELVPERSEIRDVLAYVDACREQLGVRSPIETADEKKNLGDEDGPESMKVGPQELFDLVRKATQSLLSCVEADGPEADFDTLSDCIRVMREAAQAAQTHGRADLAAAINALIEQIRAWIGDANRAAKCVVIEPLPEEALGADDGRVSQALLEAAQESVSVGARIAPANEQLEEHRKIVAQTIDANDFARAQESKRTYDDAVAAFGQSVDRIRALWAAEIPAVPVSPVVIPASVRALLKLDSGRSIDGIGPTAQSNMPARHAGVDESPAAQDCGIPSAEEEDAAEDSFAGGDAPAIEAAVPTDPRAEPLSGAASEGPAAVVAGVSAALPPAEPAEPAIPLAAVRAKRVAAHPKGAEPNAEETALKPAPTSASTETGGPVPASTPADLAVKAIQRLLEADAPGLALTLARLYEDTNFDELPGGPSFYTLLCAATAGCSIEPIRYDSLDRHFELLIQQIVSSGSEELAQAQAMAYLAAVVRPALFVRNASATYHLDTVRQVLGSPALEHLADLLEEPVQQRLDATPETLRRAAGNADRVRQQRLAQHAVRARQIIENLDGVTRHDFSNHANSQNTWKYLRAKDHPFGAALHAIAAKEDEAAIRAKVKAAAEHYALGAEICLDAAYSRFANDRLIRTNRLRLLSSVEHIHAFLSEVGEHLKPANRDEGARLAEFSDRLFGALSSAIAESAQAPHSGLRGLAQSVLVRVMKNLCSLLEEKDVVRPHATLEDRLHRDLVLTDIDLGVEIDCANSVAKSALSLSREFMLHGEPAALAEKLAAYTPGPSDVHALAAACRDHLHGNRIISGMVALNYVRSDPAGQPELAELEELYEITRAAARRQLEEKARYARRVVSRAAFSTLLPPADLAGLESAIQRIMDLAQILPYQGPVNSPLSNDTPRDFVQATQYLDMEILARVDRKQAAALTQFEARVAAERGDLRDPGSPAVDRVLTLARQGQIVPAEEFWTQLRGGQELPSLQMGNVPLRVFHREFVPAVEKAGRMANILEDLIKALREGAREFHGQPLDPAAAEDSIRLIEAWQQVASTPPNQTGRLVASFFTKLLGREATSTTPPELHGQITCVDLMDVDFKQTVGNEAFVVPRIGSAAWSQFRVAVAGRNSNLPGVRDALSRNPDIVLTRARIALVDRRRLYKEIYDTATSPGRGSLIIDEVLLAFAALAPHSAASRIVAVASTFLYTQPYKVENATAPEMFFGRRDAERLILESNSALIYGGRRLGKTSVISEICRKYTSRARKQFFVHVELKAGLDRNNYASTVWESIGKALIDDKVLQSTGIQFNTGKGSAVINAIKQAFQDGKISKLTIYLDEADVFMKYEEMTSFEVLYEINDLAMRFPEFRYAISGLNNVQRISLGWNSRLGRIGKPVAITPFIGDERHAGLRLICEPMAALGFEFESEDLPLQILSAASFYPALIQAYCSYLLDNLYRRPVRGEPPFLITQKDLLDTESNEKLVKDMLDIFNYTVSLDPRYTAICGIIAESQASSERVGDTAVELSAITDRAVSVAPHLFPMGNPTVIVEAAAEALINLGILVRLPNTQLYQFRSPRILSRLRELPQVRDFLANPNVEVAFPEPDPSEGRPKFADGTLCPIPLRMINAIFAPAKEQESVRLLVASPATGYAQLRKLGSDTDWTSGRAVTRPGMADTETALNALMDKLVQSRTPVAGERGRPKLTLKRPSDERELFVVSGHWLPAAASRLESIDRRVREEHRSVLLICEPDRAWERASHARTRVSFLPLWNIAALRVHLQHEELMDFQGEATLNELLSLTGGCSVLVDAACHYLHTHAKMPTLKELLTIASVPQTLRGACQFFGIRPEHDALIENVAAVSKPREEFERMLAQDNGADDSKRLFTYLEWMGALVLDHRGNWSLNRALETAIVELA